MGGDFWRGAATGASVGLLNHLGDKVNQEVIRKRILKDGRLTLSEANEWYRYGKGKSLTVDASKVDLDFIDIGDWKVGDQRAVQTLYESRDGRVYGNLTLEYKGNSNFSINKDTYNFEMHSVKTVKTWFRNQFTRIGAWHAGKGQQFDIYFSGYNKVNNYKPYQPY